MEKLATKYPLIYLFFYSIQVEEENDNQKDVMAIREDVLCCRLHLVDGYCLAVDWWWTANRRRLPLLCHDRWLLLHTLLLTASRRARLSLMHWASMCPTADSCRCFLLLGLCAAVLHGITYLTCTTDFISLQKFIQSSCLSIVVFAFKAKMDNCGKFHMINWLSSCNVSVTHWGSCLILIWFWSLVSFKLSSLCAV